MSTEKEHLIAEKEHLIARVKAAALEAVKHQEEFAAEDIEARKIVTVLERFLRTQGRVVYGGAAINAHMPAAHKFYDPALNLPDYDFMTPDPLQDCADLITTFYGEGFREVEARFGIHEGTYKIFVNYRPAADITYVPPDVYEGVYADAKTIQGIRYASVNFLRMNIYLELSRPAGMVSRWEKVYERLLLLNEFHPLKVARCAAEPLRSLASASASTRKGSKGQQALHKRIVDYGIESGAIFLSGASYLVHRAPSPFEVVLLMSNIVPTVVDTLVSHMGLVATPFASVGELLPARTELRGPGPNRALVAVVFETVACHSFVTLDRPKGYRLASVDLLIQMYYAFHFARIEDYVSARLMCVLQELIDFEAQQRKLAAAGKATRFDVFPLDCIGHQPTMPELKRAHRERVREKRAELAAVADVGVSSRALV